MTVKQRQNRPKTRAPHGAAEYSERISLWVTPKQKKKFSKPGNGSGWLRALMDKA